MPFKLNGAVCVSNQVEATSLFQLIIKLSSRKPNTKFRNKFCCAEDDPLQQRVTLCTLCGLAVQPLFNWSGESNHIIVYCWWISTLPPSLQDHWPGPGPDTMSVNNKQQGVDSAKNNIAN